MLHIIYSWQSYYGLAREFKGFKEVYSFFVAEVIRKGKTVMVNIYLQLVTARNLDLIKCELVQVRVGDHLNTFV